MVRSSGTVIAQAPARRMVPPRAPARQQFQFAYLPAAIGTAYIAFTFAVFLIWPTDWRFITVFGWFVLSVFVAAAIVALALGCWSGTGGRPRALNLAGTEILVITGGAAAVVLSFVGAEYYTGGRTPLDILDALGDQSDAYQEMLKRLQETQGERAIVAIFRGLVYPVVIGGLVIGLMFWARVSFVARGATAVNLLMLVIYSTLRGADYGLFSAVTILGGVMLIKMGQRANRPGADLKALKRLFVRTGLIGIVLAAIMIGVFSARKADRVGDTDSACFVAAGICTDFRSPVLSWMPEDLRFSSSMIVAYLTGGYYGLVLAQQQDWQPTFGLGHSAALRTLYEGFTGDPSVRLSTYEFRNEDFNWPPEYYWSSMWTAFANDVGWIGALVVTFAMGMASSASWRDSVLAGNPAAAVVFIMLLQQIIFMPMNAITFNTVDNYLTIVAWFSIWFAFGGTRQGAAAR